jgi:hypothetical protein
MPCRISQQAINLTVMRIPIKNSFLLLHSSSSSTTTLIYPLHLPPALSSPLPPTTFLRTALSLIHVAIKIPSSPSILDAMLDANCSFGGYHSSGGRKIPVCLRHHHRSGRLCVREAHRIRVATARKAHRIRLHRDQDRGPLRSRFSKSQQDRDGRL